MKINKYFIEPEPEEDYNFFMSGEKILIIFLIEIIVLIPLLIFIVK